MTKRLFVVFTSLKLCAAVTFCQEQMTPEKFKKLVATPGDSMPLAPKLAVTSFWTNASVTVVIHYEDGKVFTETNSATAKTIGGKTIVFTMQSQFYKSPMHSVLTYDEKASAYKSWGLYGETITEGIVVVDPVRKLTATTSTYGADFKELSVGTFSATEASERTWVYKAGRLFCTREVKSTPALLPK